MGAAPDNVPSNGQGVLSALPAHILLIVYVSRTESEP